jgi:hypothetical protein
VHDLTTDYEARRKEPADEHDIDPAPRGGMSPLMRELIVSYGGWDGERTWDAAAFDRRRPQEV